MRFSSSLATACLLILRLVAPRAVEPSATELAQTLQRKYDAVRDFTADFVHAYRGGVLNKQTTERGRVVIKKPGRMRWEYTSPEQKLFVSDGLTLYSYIPLDKQVIVSPVAQDNATAPALFLSGRGSITRDFTASFTEAPAGLPAGTKALKLVPIQAQAEYDWLVLSVDPVTLALRGLLTVDGQGGTSSFAFSNLKENVAPADSLFTFKIPRGVDVVKDAPAR